MGTRKYPSYLRSFRQKTGLTLRDSAYLLGISYAELSRYETHLRQMPLGVALRCCLLYGFTVQQMFAGIYQMSAEFILCRLMIFRKQLVRRLSGGPSSLALIDKLAWVTARIANLSAATI